MTQSLGLFEAYGVETEYMIVDARTLDVRPIADQILVDPELGPVQEISIGTIGVSNELALHQIELKNPSPVESLGALAKQFQAAVGELNRRLQEHGACLMPTGAHPWMDPAKEGKLWPHGDVEIYAAYDDIFGCNTHGWVNLQSVHLNLPFNGDGEFARLHSAIRVLLPILPALCASSPFLNASYSGYLDGRLEAYRVNSLIVPSISGRVIPEAIEFKTQYEHEILQPMYEDMEAHDPDGLLRYEWLNSRGAIARFDRSAIEIRLMDTQECPRADAALAGLICSVLELLVSQELSDYEQQQALSTGDLAIILDATVRHGDEARVGDSHYLQALGLPGIPMSAMSIWRELFMRAAPALPTGQAGALQLTLERGPLARRLLNQLGKAPNRSQLKDIASELCRCLSQGDMFDG